MTLQLLTHFFKIYFCQRQMLPKTFFSANDKVQIHSVPNCLLPSTPSTLIWNSWFCASSCTSGPLRLMKWPFNATCTARLIAFNSKRKKSYTLSFHLTRKARAHPPTYANHPKSIPEKWRNRGQPLLQYLLGNVKSPFQRHVQSVEGTIDTHCHTKAAAQLHSRERYL